MGLAVSACIGLEAPYMTNVPIRAILLVSAVPWSCQCQICESFFTEGDYWCPTEVDFNGRMVYEDSWGFCDPEVCHFGPEDMIGASTCMH